MNFDYNSVQKRNILDVLNDSLHDHPQSGKYMSDNEVRYKLIIDPSEDGSLMHLLFSLGVLDRQLTRIYVCSDFPGDSQTQKVGVNGRGSKSRVKSIRGFCSRKHFTYKIIYSEMRIKWPLEIIL